MNGEVKQGVLSAEDLDAIRSVVHGGLTAQEHVDHHIVIRKWLEREAMKEEFRRKLKSQLLGWSSVITAFGAIGTAGYHAFAYMRDHLK